MRRSASCMALMAVAALAVAACARTGQNGDDTTATPGEVPTATTDTASSAATDLPGTSWQLVRFEGGDGTVLTPDDRAKYTLTFQADGRISVRFDCNRGMGSWTSNGPSHLEFGPLALTRAMCPPESLHDHLVRQWPYLRSYVMRDGHLFLALMADGGIYEFEPANL